MNLLPVGLLLVNVLIGSVIFTYTETSRSLSYAGVNLDRLHGTAWKPAQFTPG